MKKLLFLTLFSYYFIGNVSGQDYELAIGVRSSETQGISIKKMHDNDCALEGILSNRKDGKQLTGLIEFYQPAFLRRTSGFFFFYGFGAHTGYYKKTSSSEKTPKTYRYFSLGIDAIAGLEYRFLSVPLITSIEYTPYIDFSGISGEKSNLMNTALSLKYTIK